MSDSPRPLTEPPDDVFGAHEVSIPDGWEQDDIPQRTGPCKVCGWETWDGVCSECEIDFACQKANMENRDD